MKILHIKTNDAVCIGKFIALNIYNGNEESLKINEAGIKLKELE